MTFLELCNRVSDESGLSDSGLSSVVGQTGILRLMVSWVRQANRDIQNLHHDWRFLWARGRGGSTVADREEYTPADFGMTQADGLRVRHIDRLIVGGVSVPLVDWDHYMAHVETDPDNIPSAESPNVATVTPQGKIKLFPKVNQVLPVVVDYYKTSVDIVANLDEPIIPAQYHDAIVFKALMYYAQEEGDDMAYVKASNLYEEHLARLLIDELPAIGVNMGAFRG